MHSQGLLVGNQEIHIAHEPWDEKYHGKKSEQPDKAKEGRKYYNHICQSPITEKEAYDLSRNVAYEQATGSFRKGEDMRICQNRHAPCYNALEAAYRENMPLNRVDINILLVCRQAYLEANPILWNTNVWSFHCQKHWIEWYSKRHATHRKELKKVHFGMELMSGYSPYRFESVAKYQGPWKELYINIDLNYGYSRSFCKLSTIH